MASFSGEKLAAAENGDPAAMLELGVAYRDGRGVERDRLRAYNWFNLAARKVREAASMRDELKRCLTQAQISEAESDVLFLLRVSMK